MSAVISEQTHSAPYKPCRKVPLSAPIGWLAKGWQDFLQAPLHSMIYGGIFTLIGWGLIYFFWSNDNQSLVMGLLAGFLVVGPLLAFGLYDISHQLERKREPSFEHERRVAFREMGHELMFALFLGMMFLLVMIGASVVNTLYPIGEDPTPQQIMVSMVLTTVVGLVFTIAVFCSSAFALPMMLAKGTDAATAIASSINAVCRNKRVALLWAMMIMVLISIGFATALIGLILVVPLLGFATWHAYREMIIDSP